MIEERTEIELIGAKIAQAIATAATIPAEAKLMTRESLAQWFCVGLTTLDGIVAQPGFPKAVKISHGPKRWIFGEVLQWVKNQRQ